MKRWGYVRVSSLEQNPERQIKALIEAGVDKKDIRIEKESAKDTKGRPVLLALLDELEPGDTILIVDLTRIIRSSRDLFDLVDTIKVKGANLKSIKDTWLDTSDDNPYSAFLLTVMVAVAQLERDLIKQRQKEGIAIAKEQGRYKGRLRKYTEAHAGMQHALELYEAGGKTVKEICEITKISRSAFYRALEKEQQHGSQFLGKIIEKEIQKKVIKRAKEK
jgi:DNA invertase Pin-like site-specific DNA recombinase